MPMILLLPVVSCFAAKEGGVLQKVCYLQYFFLCIVGNFLIGSVIQDVRNGGNRHTRLPCDIPDGGFFRHRLSLAIVFLYYTNIM